MGESTYLSHFWDDPSRDFRQRYQVPEHFLWDPYDLKTVDYEGYVEIALGLLPKPPCLVLDVGCGDGWVARKATKRGYTVTGVDYSERAIGFARLMVPEAQFHVGDVRALANNSDWKDRFEAALCIEVIEHIPVEYHVSVLLAIRYCLVAGGTLVLTVPSIYVPLNRWHYKHFTVEEGAQLLRQGGFEVQGIVNQHVLTPLSSPFLWRLLRNRFYDFRAARVILKSVLSKRFSTTDNPRRAGRYIYQAVKV